MKDWDTTYASLTEEVTRSKWYAPEVNGMTLGPEPKKKKKGMTLGIFLHHKKYWYQF